MNDGFDQFPDNSNQFPNNKLHVDIVTSGPCPEEHCIVQLTSWPVTPTPFGDKGFTMVVRPYGVFTTLVQPYKDVSLEKINPDYDWVAKPDGPIFREADTLYGAWMHYIEYLKSLYYEAVCIKVVNRSGLDDAVFFRFLFNMYKSWCAITGKESSVDYGWPFDYKVSE